MGVFQNRGVCVQAFPSFPSPTPFPRPIFRASRMRKLLLAIRYFVRLVRERLLSGQLFNPSLDFLQAVKVTKSGHHLLHDWASKRYGFIPGLTSQTSLHACLRRLNTIQISLWHQTRNRPLPFTSSVVWQMTARFRKFYNLKKAKTLFKKGQCVTSRCKDLYKRKNILGLGAL